MKDWFSRLLCRVLGHNYRVSFIDNVTNFDCARCGERLQFIGYNKGDILSVTLDGAVAVITQNSQEK